MSVDNARILVVGDVAVGKSSLLRLLSKSKPVDAPPPPTVGCELEVVFHRYEPAPDIHRANLHSYSWDSRRTDRTPQAPKDYCIELLEIGASHTHEITRRMFYHDFSGIIGVYDLTSPRSCGRLQYWLQEVLAHSFDKKDLVGSDGSFHKIPEIVTTGGDEQRSVQSHRVPVLVVGTHADQCPCLKQDTRIYLDKLLTDYSAMQITLSSKRLSDFAAGTDAASKLSAFYSSVVETRFFPALLSSYSKPNSPDLRARKLRSVAM